MMSWSLLAGKGISSITALVLSFRGNVGPYLTQTFFALPGFMIRSHSCFECVFEILTCAYNFRGISLLRSIRYN